MQTGLLQHSKAWRPANCSCSFSGSVEEFAAYLILRTVPPQLILKQLQRFDTTVAKTIGSLQSAALSENTLLQLAPQLRLGGLGFTRAMNVVHGCRVPFRDRRCRPSQSTPGIWLTSTAQPRSAGKSLWVILILRLPWKLCLTRFPHAAR